MKVDAEAIARAKAEREERKKRLASAKRDVIQIDPQAAETGATSGLKNNIISENEVELSWSTNDEMGNLGFIVQRRRGGSVDFVDVASYETLPSLKSKGPQGGTYKYLDDGVDVGNYFYRIVDCDASGSKSALCQQLVEIESGDEKTQTLVVGAFIALVAVGLVVTGSLLDPIQTTDITGRSF